MMISSKYVTVILRRYVALTSYTEEIDITDYVEI